MEKTSKPKISIVIPCLNERSTIGRAISRAFGSGQKYLDKNFEIIVSDNGSNDGTLVKLAKMKNIRLIQVPIKGYGAALHYAITRAKYPYVFFADADLSYDFDELYRFIPCIKVGADLILGSRFTGTIKDGAMPFINRYLGTPILTFLIRLIYKIDTTDCNSGMRIVRKTFYQSLKMQNSGMEWASELLVRTVLNKGRYKEVPITFYRDQRGRNTHLKRWEDGWRHFKVIILLKPILLIYFSLAFIFLGILLLPSSINSTIGMFLFAEFFFLSYLITKRLESAIYRKSNNITSFTDRMPLVFFAVIITVFGFLQIFFISDKYTIFKYILLFHAVLFDLWLFFNETIKTHLVNSLKVKY